MIAVTGQFSRKSKLLTAKDYGRVFDNPVRSSDNCFTILARVNGCFAARLGLAVSKKNAKRAVDRNRIKRLVRESFRAHMNELKGVDVVVMNRQQTAQKDNITLARSLDRHWLKLMSQCVES